MRPLVAGSPAVRTLLRVMATAFGVFMMVAEPVWAGPNELGHPVIRSFPPGRAGISHQAQALAQDKDGFIYLANGLSVHYFDGATWPTIAQPTESAGVRAFATTPGGTVFAGGAGVLGYFRAAGLAREFVSLAARLPPSELGCDEIYDAAALGDAVYFADEEKILIWRAGRFKVLPWRAPAHSHGARFHVVDGALYVSTLSRALCRLTAKDQMETVADDPILRENQIISVAAGPASSLVVLTATRGFFRCDAGHVERFSTEANRWLDGRTVLRAQRLGDGSFVVAFASISGDGGMRFAADGRYLGPLDQSIGLYVRTIRNFFCDRDGGLWLATETGTIRLEWPSPVTVFDAVTGLGGGTVNDVVRHDGTLYAATTEGVYCLAPSDEAGHCARFEWLDRHPAYALASHPAGLLVLGYADIRVETAAGFARVATVAPGGGTLSVSRRDPSRVWIGTTHGIQSLRHTAAGWQDEGVIAGFDENTRAPAEAPDGSLWVPTAEHGLFHLDFGAERNSSRAVPHIERFAGGSGLPDNFQRMTVAEWGGEPIFLVNTSQSFRFGPGAHRFFPLVGTDALPVGKQDEAWIASRGTTGTGQSLWLANSASIFSVSRPGAEPRRLPQLVSEAAGAAAQMYVDSTAAGPILWICGAKGLVRLDATQPVAPAAPFATLLDSTGVHEGERLKPRPAALKFGYVALRTQLANSVAYQTRLTGHDDDWSPWSQERERVFSDLPAGDYRFEVRARDVDGRLSNTAALDFAVMAPWWQTRWTLLAEVAAGLGLLAGIVRLRTRALRHRARHLEQIVVERTRQLARHAEELSAQNAELVRLNRLELDEKISARLAEEKARLEVLRYQLNPHFLFNTLASISSSLPPERSVSRSMVDRLAEFCRLTLHRGNDHDWTTLGEEIQLLRAYLDIERSRWGDLLDTEIACDPALDGERLPHFLLLPLLENALKYGRATSRDRVGIRLAARRAENGDLVLEVANTGEWVEPGARRNVSSLGIGLENLRERLARHFPRSHRLTLSHAEGWVTVVLHLFPASASAPSKSP